MALSRKQQSRPTSHSSAGSNSGQRKSEYNRKFVALISATLAAPATDKANKVPRSRLASKRHATSTVIAPVAT